MKTVSLDLRRIKESVFADSDWIEILKISEIWLTVGTVIFNHIIACFKPLPCEKVKTLKRKVKIC